MNKKFTASEVRDIAWSLDGLSRQMLRDYADLLEAQEKAVPVAEVVREIEKPGVVHEYAALNESLTVGTKLYTHPAPSDAEGLAEALRNLVSEWVAIADDGDATLEDSTIGYRACANRLSAIKQREQDKRDAARYRWLRDKSGRAGSPYIRCDDPPFKPMDYWITAGTADSCIDRAMAKESGNE